MLRSIKTIFATSTFRQSGITFSATLLNGALGAVFYIIAARLLGPADFGLLSVAITVLTLGASIGGLGVNTGLVRFVSEYQNKNKTKAFKYLKLSLKANLAISLVLLLLGFLLSDATATLLLNKPELADALKVSFAGAGFLLLFGFSVRYLQAAQRFWAWGLLQIGTNLIRIVVVMSIFAIGWLNLQTSLWIYALMPLLGFIIAFIFLQPKGFLKVKNENSVAKEFFHYNKWIASFTLIAAISSRVDTFISARLISSEDLGIYSAATQLVYIVPQIVGAIGTVIAPKMATMGSLAEFKSYLKKTQLLVVGIALLGVLSIPVVALLVPIIFGNLYLASIPLFVVLLLAMLIFLISVPVHNAIFYYFSYPRLFFFLAVGHLLIAMILGWLLISNYGAMGAAITVLVGSIFNFIVPAIWVINKIRK